MGYGIKRASNGWELSLLKNVDGWMITQLGTAPVGEAGTASTDFVAVSWLKYSVVPNGPGPVPNISKPASYLLFQKK